MRGATRCARKVKRLWRSLRARAGKIHLPAVGDPVTQLVLGVFTRDAPEARAREALERMRAMVVDYNDLRVIPPLELAQIVGNYPQVREKCEDLSRALNRIFALEHQVSLDRLAGMSRRDALAYLARIDGLEPYTIARIRLLGLGHHAIPLDEAMWTYARSAGIVDSRCPLEEAQAFLERQIPEPDALEFFTVLRKVAWSECGSAVRRGQVPRIKSIPPDRTSRNMLRLIASGSGAGAVGGGSRAVAPAGDGPSAPVRPAPRAPEPTSRAGARSASRSSAASRSRKSARSSRRVGTA